MPSTIEYAVSGRAKCRTCSFTIGMGQVRVGDEAFGDYGPYTKWHHLACYGFRSGTSPQSVPGYSRLRAADQAAVRAAIGGRSSGAAATAATAAAWSRLPSRAADGAAVDEAYREQHDVFYGEAAVAIVGCQYYGGVIHEGEMADLVREPGNPYDGNAVRVDNLRGVQVGHLKRVFAAALAPILDDASPAAVDVEAVVPRAPTSVYQVAAIARFRGLEDHFAATAAHLARFGLRLSGGLAAARAPPPPRRTATVVTRVVAASPATAAKELDAVYDKMSADLACIDPSPFAAALGPVLETALLPHQLQAVAFMASKESGYALGEASEAIGGRDAPRPPLAPLWEARTERGQAVYLNTATNASQQGRPPDVRGGLLADDMGLGKTLSVLALVVARDARLLRPGGGGGGGGGDDDAARTRAKKMKVGALRAALDAAGDDSTGLKAALVDKYVALSRAKAGASSSATCGPTLIVCPTSVIGNWVDQAKAHAPSLKVLAYHGADRASTDVSGFDVVVTSYGVLVAEALPEDTASTKKRPRAGGGLFETRWRRCVLDEAHVARNPRTKTFKALRQVDATYRWCATGTPMVNKVEDFYAIFAFLRCAPVDDAAVFARAVSRPIKDGDAAGLARLRLLVKSLSLRRSKALLASSLPTRTTSTTFVALSEADRAAYEALFRTAKVAVDGLGDDALRLYSSILECLLRLRQVCAGGAALVPRARLQAARAALDGLRASSLSKRDAESLLARLKAALSSSQADGASDEGTFECAVCLDDVPADAAKILRNCGHHFCATCADALPRKCAGKGCPLCRAPFTEADLVSSSEAAKAADAPAAPDGAAVKGDDDAPASTGPKVAAVLEAARRLPAGEKMVVFSQFVGVLVNAHCALDDAGVASRVFSGALSQAKRAALLSDFAGEGGPRVLLVSLKCGGTGLNLTRANHCYLLDTWWNSAVEDQALDRVHRLGQTRPVTCVRLVADETVEHRILDIQQAKRLLGEGALAKLSPDQVRKARLGDIARLFEPYPNKEQAT